jgi:glyoxylase-like metal-dependent hydrolase (beta-lactamase superfamily II)
VEEGADRDFAPDVSVRDGDIIKGDGYSFVCVHTPGHTSNHICYALEQEQALFSGDHVMGWSTTVVAPPDGDMTAYMRSLERLLARDDRVYWPTHGGAILNPKDYVSALLRHRRAREAQIVQALRDGKAKIPQLVQRIYAGLDPRLHRAAALNVLAHLVKLIQEGSVAADGEGLNARYRLSP